MLSKQSRNQKLKQRSTYRGASNSISQSHIDNKSVSSSSSRNPHNIRVVQSHLLYVIGLKPDICQESTLATKQFFGKYGNVTKVIINKKGSTNRKYHHDISYAAHITYEDQISASLAVVSLFEFKYQDFLMRSCFGYIKYCDSFYYGKECYKNDCQYLHEFQTEQEIVAADVGDKESEKQNFEKQLKIALRNIYRNRKQIIRNYKQQKEHCSDFPDLYDSMKKLIDYGFMTEEQYQREWDDEDTKCYTQSTQTSPIKQYELDSEKHEDDRSQQSKREIQNQIQSQISYQKQSIAEIESVEQNIRVVKKVVNPIRQLEQKIHKSIVRIIRGKNRHTKSKFQFGGQKGSSSKEITALLERQLLFLA